MAINTKRAKTADLEILVHRGYEEIRVPGIKELTLLENLQTKKIDISGSCGGNGTCGTCKVKITSGIDNVDERNEIEQEFAADRGFAANERLACQTHCSGNVEIFIPSSIQQKRD